VLTGKHGRVTVSAGVAGAQTGESCMQWVARADAALYVAKQSGRNRVHLAD
jgi:diguanylate cyclase (GGDEF)-like protein